MLSRNIPLGPRNPNGYTEEEVNDALLAVHGSRKLTFRYELLDGNMNRIRDLENVISGSIQQQYISEIKREASFSIEDREDIDYLHHHIKPYCRLWMPPRWIPEHEVAFWKWRNNFAAEEEGPVTDVEELSSLGDDVETVSGALDLVLSPRIVSSASLRFGGSGGEAGLVTTAPTAPVESQRRRFRTYLYSGDGASYQLVWRNENGERYGMDGDNDQGGFVVKGDLGQVWLGEYDLGSGAYDSLKGKWIRVEIDFDYEALTVEYRLYTSNPHGAEADQTHVHNIPDPGIDPLNRVYGFEIDRWADNGSFPDSLLYVGPTMLGDLVVVPAKPNPTDHDFVEVPLGVFLISSPDKNIDANQEVRREISAYDRTQLLIDDKLTERFVITKGENYTAVLNSLLADYPRIIEPSTWVCGRTREFSVGTSMKEVVDRIAESINFHTVRFDEEGRLVLASYVSPGDRTPEYHYTDDQYSIMYPDVEVGFDLSEIANVWIVSLNEADESSVYIKLENWDPANPFSIPSRGRKIVDFREQEEGFDRASLMRKAKRIQFEANRVYENISFKTAINPFHSDNDCYTMDYTVAGVNNKYTEINWEMSLEAGAEMSHSCRRIVELDPELFPGFVDGHLQVNGAATMSNIKWGTTPLFTPVANKPTSFLVTGLGLKGTGPTHVFLTAQSRVPGTVKASGVRKRSSNAFTIWTYRTNNTANGYYWVAMRDV